MSSHLLKLTWDILMWAFPRLASIRAMYVPGVSNVVADFLSHHRPLPGEWRLNPEVVQMIWHRFGRANLDLFASKESTHCPLWFSWTEQSSPLGQDALAHTWPDLLVYAFPPTPLIQPSLHRKRRGYYKVLLVAPNWPGRPWFPLLYKLIRGNPGVFPRDRIFSCSCRERFGIQIQTDYSSNSRVMPCATAVMFSAVSAGE